MKQYRDSIDFGKENIPRLFLKLFVPTLLGLFFGAMLNLADGIFVGQGVGSDALAAVNVAAPVFMIGTGTALLFGGEGRIVPYACDYLVAVAPVLVLTQESLAHGEEYRLYGQDRSPIVHWRDRHFGNDHHGQLQLLAPVA